MINFRSYFLPKKFVILTLEEAFPIILHHVDVSPRIAKWVLRLQEFEYTIQVESSTRSSLVGILSHCLFEKKLKISMPTPPPLEEVKLELAHSLFFDGAYKRVIDSSKYGGL